LAPEKQEFTIAIPVPETVDPNPNATLFPGSGAPKSIVQSPSMKSGWTGAENVSILSYPESANEPNAKENERSSGPRTGLWTSVVVLIGIAFLSLVAFEKHRLPTFVYGVQGREDASTAAKAPLPATETLGKPPSVRPEAASEVPTFVLQVGAMAHEENAITLAESLVQRHFPAFVAKPDATRLYLVFVGPYNDTDDATRVKRDLEQQGFTSIRAEWKAPRSNDISGKLSHRP
jgi:hypothetical protein